MNKEFQEFIDSRFLKQLLRLGSAMELDPDERRRRLTAVFILVTGISVTFFFSIFHLLFNRYYIVMANLASCAVLVLSLFILRKMKNGRVFYRVLAVFFTIIFALIIIEGRKEISFFLWSFIFPAASFSVLGKRDGVLANFLFLVMSLLLMTLGSPIFESPPYSSYVTVRYIIAYITLTFIIYNYEMSQQLLFRYVKREKDRYETASRYDPLTGLSNRGDIREKMLLEQQRQRRMTKSFSVILGDIDNFKKLNDTYGHDCGDYVLVRVSDIIKQQLRDVDCPSRWGGEEFLILLVETDLEGCRVVAERIRREIEASELHYDENKLSITMTFGISACSGIGDEIDSCIKEADKALYEGKRKGKNRVVASRGEQS